MQRSMENRKYINALVSFKDNSVYSFIMKFITQIIKKFVKEDKKVLGRWNMEYCDNKMNKKIDLSNEDHCGPCGQYILHKSNKIIKSTSIITNNKNI